MFGSLIISRSLKASNAPRKLSIGQKDGQRIVDQSSSSGICTCCGAQNIPVWRKDDAGMPICGECMLILRFYFEILTCLLMFTFQQ